MTDKFSLMLLFLSHWQPMFFVAACLMGICTVGLLFYFLKVWCRARGEPRGNGMAAVSGGGVADVMGKVRLEAGVQEVRMSELVFDRSGIAENLRKVVSVESVGMADDVMDEVSKCFDLIGEMDGKKEDFMRMMAGLEGIYPEMADHPALAEVRAFISSHAPFALSKQELAGFWG
ncbi:hypothetical protein J7E50_05480 [Pedobacter sp. ISL-68]|uniref:hypothetical protein n=1 Tax=unclassified Pedobacter TaxID=2628915 RepID=UPI001BE643C1|nr:MULTISPECIES: hypothetical protein [unclassified Pedobacter]MBT2563767.1 hypothetical protein [Pedobacter sp. ISL-64]MBT2589659.1 hypothetical protein [Pedobacter sp. ISL-68]